MHMRDFLPAEICVEMYCQEREYSAVARSSAKGYCYARLCSMRIQWYLIIIEQILRLMHCTSKMLGYCNAVHSVCCKLRVGAGEFGVGK